MADCPYKGKCCFRGTEDSELECQILADTNFTDNKCHFRKVDHAAPNAYDMERKARYAKAPLPGELAEARRLMLQVSADYAGWATRIRNDIRYKREVRELLDVELEQNKAAQKAIKTIMDCLDFVEVRR